MIGRVGQQDGRVCLLRVVLCGQVSNGCGTACDERLQPLPRSGLASEKCREQDQLEAGRYMGRRAARVTRVGRVWAVLAQWKVWSYLLIDEGPSKDVLDWPAKKLQMTFCALPGNVSRADGHPEGQRPAQPGPPCRSVRFARERAWSRVWTGGAPLDVVVAVGLREG